MTVYRTQPQAESNIYREVLGAGTDGGRCNIIEFYNQIYVRDMQEFVLRLRSSEDVTLSPLPVNVRTQMIKRKVSQNHSIYVQELQSTEILQSPEAITYTFISSPIQVSFMHVFVFSLQINYIFFCFLFRILKNWIHHCNVKNAIQMANEHYHSAKSINQIKTRLNHLNEFYHILVKNCEA